MTARLVIAGVSSGVGKTSVTVALGRALCRRGLKVAMFKCGPDYLDPTYHARASFGVCHNLDGFLMGEEGVQSTFASAAEGADIALIEGVMGLFDGASSTSDEGSTAEIAKWLRAPVVLVCDASGMARSVAALVHGYATFDPELTVRGVICNRLGSAGHLTLLREALPADLAYVAGLPRRPELRFQERHLGLRTAEREAVPEEQFEAWGALAQEWLSPEALLALARSAEPLACEHVQRAKGPRVCRVGIARDEAFHFYYDYNLRALEREGAELVPFSPLHDRVLPEVDALLFGGGYPEVHAANLAQNGSMLDAVRAFSAADKPIYAECGGLMFLTRSIRTLDGVSHQMVGIVPGEAVMAQKLSALGYVTVTTSEDTFLGPKGTRYRGHQFRYSDLTLEGEVARVCEVLRRRGGEPTREGYAVRNTFASYVHAHWASNPRIPRAIVAAAKRTRG
jgi:cobyrinic acid a,c-diamide synthase